MGRVTDELISLIEKQVKDKGIVVWYDPELAYGGVVENMSLPDVIVLSFRGSFFELRERLEPLLEFVGPDGRIQKDALTPPKVIIYVPKDEQKANNPLIEVSAAGVVMRPAADHWQRNTSLKVIAERVFRSIAPDEAANIARKVDEGSYTLEDLDRLELNARIGAGAIKLIFGTASVADVVLTFVASAEKDEAIASKQALTEFAGMVETELGIDISPTEPLERVRETLRRDLLLSEFVAHLPSDSRPVEFSSLAIPQRQKYLDAIRKICATWRNRLDLRESYLEAARAIESEAAIRKLDLKPETLVEVDTFPSIEERLLIYGEERFLEGDPEAALEFAAKRKQSFWSVEEPTNQLRWSLVEGAAQLLVMARRIKAELKSVKKNPSYMVKAYAEGAPAQSGGESKPWCLLDTYHRHLERQYTTFDLEIGGEHDLLEQVIYSARRHYSEVIGFLAESFTAAMEASDFEVKGVLAQEKVFPALVAPLIKGSGEAGRKTAYILVDALRFEMGRELLEGLGDEFEVSLQPGIAQLPSITEVGMSALMPGAEGGMYLVEAGAGKVAVRIGDTVLKDRPARVKHLKGSVEVETIDLKLNNLMKPTRKTREEIEAADFLLITSQEIDRRGEEAGDEDETRQYMDDVLDKLRKGIRRLASLKVTDFVITADHGHLFGDTIESGMKIDAPGGKTIDLHRRVWIGQGGSSTDGCVRIPASRVGLGGEMELVFPRGFACFIAKAGSTAYFHGAASLEEIVIPVAVVKTRQQMNPKAEEAVIELTMEKSRITTRFFSITATYRAEGLFAPQEKRVKVLARAGKKEAAVAVMAAYGFEEGTQEIVLQNGQPDAITLILTEDKELKTITVEVIDAVSQIQLQSLPGIPVDIGL